MKHIMSSILLVVVLSSCNKLLDVNPPVTSITGGSVYTDDATAMAVLTGMYVRLSDNSLASGLNSISIRSGLSADELSVYNGASNTLLQKFYANALSSQDYYGIWENSYTYLQTANAALEGLAASSSITPAVKKQLQGEAKFLRAFFHFYLTNLYGDIPLATSSDYRENGTSVRVSVDHVYQQIISDLKDAQDLLSESYIAADGINTTIDRVRPNKWTATALLARVYLYRRDWVNAEAQATDIINSGMYGLETDINNVFLANNKEAIWQLMPVDPSWNTYDAKTFILTNGPDSDDHPVYISPFLLNAFEINDKRRLNWIGTNKVGTSTYYYPYKYKSATPGAQVTEYTVVFRLAEQYLIRAEARAQQDNIIGSNGAQEDLNEVRFRAGLTATDATTKSDITVDIMKERQQELFTEWGHRWFDLKRSDMIDIVMGQVTSKKGGVWSSNWQLYPVPFADIKLNPKLTQNYGY